MPTLSTDRFLLLPVGRDAGSVASLTRALTEIFGGRSERVLVPVGPSENMDALRADLAARVVRLPQGVHLVMRTSGSTTGHGRLVGLSADALRASAAATQDRLGGQGSWLLALPPHHIAGFQVVARSLLAGREPVLLEGRVTSARLAEVLRRAVRADPHGRVHVSLVPTQLRGALDDPAATRALASAASVLVGGDSTPAQLAERARATGLPLHMSYGMSETCGGCVYDGSPLGGVSVRFGDAPSSVNGRGRIWLTGPMLMGGYLDADPGVVLEGGRAWLATNDLGHRDGDRLVVEGRLDDAIITGGLKISAVDVRDAVLASGLVREAVVIGLPDERWGQVVSAVVVVEGSWDAHSAQRLRDEVGAVIGRERAPRVVLAVEALPRLASGKADRCAAATLVDAARHDGRAWSSG